MPILAIFASSNTDVVDLVAAKRDLLVPADLREAGYRALNGETVTVSGYLVKPRTGLAELLAFIETFPIEEYAGVLVISDESIPDLDQSVGDVFCITVFPTPGYGAKLQNLLQAVLSKSLKTFRFYKTRFSDLKYHQILRLPLRNFVSAELRQVQALCRNMTQADNFGRQLDRQLGLLRDRQRPKKVSSYPDRYLIDDEEKHFRLGPEEHAKADTAQPPHSPICVLGNKFRFGCWFDGNKHFNVSMEKNGPMNGLYPDCHGAHRKGSGDDHLNMFSNDFF